MLTYVGKIENENTITIDGYTTNKTDKGIIKDVARAIREYNETESKSLLSFLDCYDKKYNTPFLSARDSEGGYFFEIEEVPCATCYNEKTDEMEYKDGFNTYFCIRLIK